MISFALTVSSKRPVTEWHERRTTSSSKADHEARRAFFRTATLEEDLAEISLSKIDQIAKSIGFMSMVRPEGCHMFCFLPKHAEMIFAPLLRQIPFVGRSTVFTDAVAVFKTFSDPV